jgi:hypothetical protein
MARGIAVLDRQGVTSADADGLPESTKRFADGSRWKIEIPSVEGPLAMAAVVEEVANYGMTIHRVSQGSGIMMQTDDEIREMVELGRAQDIEVCLFIGPRAAWDIGKAASTAGGATTQPSLRGADQLRYAVEDVLHGVDLGVRSVLVGDVGLLGVLGRARADGDLPSDFIIKTSVSLPCNNPATAKLYEDLGASTLNLTTDLSLEQVAAIRSQVDVPVDIYVEAADDFGAAIRHYEVPDLVRVAAPVHLKFTVRNSPALYPAGLHLQAALEATARERVRRAFIGTSMLARYGFK